MVVFIPGTEKWVNQDLIDRGELLKRLFPLGVEDLDYSVKAALLYEIVINMERIEDNGREMLKEYPIECLGLSERAYNGLIGWGRCRIETVADVLDISLHDMRRIRNLGDKSILEIQKKVKAFLTEHGFIIMDE